ncbi:MAG: hypothetical protein P8Z49_09460 [Acidobacteriota bacterium]
MKRVLILFILAAVAVPAVVLAAAPQNQGLVAAYSDGHGTVELMWPIPNGTWPSGGYVLQRVDAGSGQVKVLAEGLRPGSNPALLSALPGQQSDVLKKLDAMDRRVAAGAKGAAAENFDGAKAFLFISAVRDFKFARAMGVAFEDHPQGAGPYVYRLVGEKGSVMGVSLPVDPREISPRADAPGEVRAEATPEGVKLYWAPPQPTPGMPVVVFRVKRNDGAGPELIGKGPILPGAESPANTKAPPPRFVDRYPPVEKKISYIVVGKDVFGRETAPSPPATVFVPDYAASAPPRDLAAKVEGGSILLRWQPNKDPHTAGYVLQRSAFQQGPYVSLTGKPLASKQNSYQDRSGVPGARYYYRILSIGPRNRVGDPSQAVAAVWHAAGPPGSPKDLRAKLGVSTIQLRWGAVKGAAAYIVEKESKGASRWSPVTPRPTPEARYDDPIVPGMTGTLVYRVSAVGGDGQRSKPSPELSVPMPSNLPPPVPHLTGISGLHGKVRLTFIPGGAPSRTARFYVLRSAKADGERTVVNSDGLEAGARSYVDDSVLPGMTYWYQVVAVDTAGNRSAPSDAASVRVGEAVLAAAPTPTVEYRSKPYPAVVIHFPPAPPGVSVVVERRGAGESSWTLAAGPVPPGIDHGVDARPLPGKAEYRIYYRASTGADGPPSPPASVETP